MVCKQRKTIPADVWNWIKIETLTLAVALQELKTYKKSYHKPEMHASKLIIMYLAAAHW